MAEPKPVVITQVAAESYTGQYSPEPLLAVGPIPGADGGQVDEITAGDGIDVDATDPAAPVVSLDLTGVADYSAGATQTLKHIAGTLTWVTDA